MQLSQLFPFFFLQKLTRGAISHRIIHHICTSASKFSIKSSPFLCSMSHSLIHHSRQGDWAAARVVNDHSESGSKHEETPTGTKRICAKCSPFLMVNYFVGPLFKRRQGRPANTFPNFLFVCLNWIWGQISPLIKLQLCVLTADGSLILSKIFGSQTLQRLDALLEPFSCQW